MGRKFEENEEKMVVTKIKIEKADRLPRHGKRGAVAVGRLGSY